MLNKIRVWTSWLFFFFPLQLFENFQTTPYRISRTPWRLIPTTTLCCQPTRLRTNRKEKQLVWQRPLCKTVRRKSKTNRIASKNWDVKTILSLVFDSSNVFYMSPQLKRWGSSYCEIWKRTVGATTPMTRPPTRWQVKGARWLSDRSRSLWRRSSSSAQTNGMLSLKRSGHRTRSSPAFRSWGKVTDQIKRSVLNSCL